MANSPTVSAGYPKRVARIIQRAGGQVNLAKAAGVRQSTISGWLRGSVPYQSVLETMCSNIGINPRWVLFGEEPEELSPEEPETQAVAHIGRGAVVRDDALPADLEVNQICAELSGLIEVWPDTPGALQRMGWDRIDALYKELQRRVHLEIDARHTARKAASNIYPWPKGASK